MAKSPCVIMVSVNRSRSFVSPCLIVNPHLSPWFAGKSMANPHMSPCFMVEIRKIDNPWFHNFWCVNGGFRKNSGTPNSHPNFSRIFHEINHPASLGYTPISGNPPPHTLFPFRQGAGPMRATEKQKSDGLPFPWVEKCWKSGLKWDLTIKNLELTIKKWWFKHQTDEFNHEMSETSYFNQPSIGGF